MKNVITIVVDAYCYNNLRRKIGGQEVTPFLNELTKQSVSFGSMYALAPYTEASLVALLGGENTLENGGYLFGNANAKSAVMKDYQDAGYTTILSYSPYVCSRSYLKGVSQYRYVRLFSILPCFDYRFNYFREKRRTGDFHECYYDACIIILDEAFETWEEQCNALITGDASATLIRPFVNDMATIRSVKETLQHEHDVYKQNKKTYLDSLFLEWKTHRLVELNDIYNARKPLENLSWLRSTYNRALCEFQNIYSDTCLKRLRIDWKYVCNIFLRDADRKNSLRLTRNYVRHKQSRDLEQYLNAINGQSKPEVSMQTIFDGFMPDIKRCDENNENYFIYLQPQDFHLPSLFHSFDTKDKSVLAEEFEEAFSLLKSLDENYRGNIIADLSAHFCDFKLRQFYRRLRKELKNDFIFVVTADHGFPSYYDPPRPFIYNQTYTEAFHVPFIVGARKQNPMNMMDGVYSVLDGIEYVKHLAGVNGAPELESRPYLLTEYAGPGCPMITEKKVWYTLISKDWKLSVEVSLGERVDWDDVKSLYNLKTDPEQKHNLRGGAQHTEVWELLCCISERNVELGKKFPAENWIENMIQTMDYQH